MCSSSPQSHQRSHSGSHKGSASARAASVTLPKFKEVTATAKPSRSSPPPRAEGGGLHQHQSPHRNIFAVPVLAHLNVCCQQDPACPGIWTARCFCIPSVSMAPLALVSWFTSTFRKLHLLDRRRNSIVHLLVGSETIRSRAGVRPLVIVIVISRRGRWRLLHQLVLRRARGLRIGNVDIPILFGP